MESAARIDDKWSLLWSIEMHRNEKIAHVANRAVDEGVLINRGLMVASHDTFYRSNFTQVSKFRVRALRSSQALVRHREQRKSMGLRRR